MESWALGVNVLQIGTFVLASRCLSLEMKWRSSLLALLLSLGAACLHISLHQRVFCLSPLWDTPLDKLINRRFSVSSGSWFLWVALPVSSKLNFRRVFGDVGYDLLVKLPLRVSWFWMTMGAIPTHVWNAWWLSAVCWPVPLWPPGDIWQCRETLWLSQRGQWERR